MTDFSRESAERISALMDGRLYGDEFVAALQDLQHNPRMLADWDAYHVIGRTLRSGAVEAQAFDSTFLARLNHRLKTEPVAIESIAATPFVAATTYLPPVAANSGNWLRVVGLASVMLVAVLAWQGLTPVTQAPGGGSVAQSNEPAGTTSAVVTASAGSGPTGQVLIRSDGTSVLTRSSDAGVMIRDPQLDALLATHRNFAGASALQMAPGFVRNANFEEAGR
jgi:sigma-E factor negative regulatory protein RseA